MKRAEFCKHSWQGQNRFSIINQKHFDGRSVELQRRTPCIRRRMWQTHSRDWRTLAVCTPTQPPWHLLLLNWQLTCPILILLKTHPQQDAFLSLPVNVLPMTIHPFPMFSVHPCDLILQVIHHGLQLFNLPLQHCHLIVIVVVLEGRLVRYSSKEYASSPLTCAMFPSINLHNCSPIAAEYLIALVAPSLGLSVTSWSKRPQFKRWNRTLVSASTTSAVRISLLTSNWCWATTGKPETWSSRTMLVGKLFDTSPVAIPTTIAAI